MDEITVAHGCDEVNTTVVGEFRCGGLLDGRAGVDREDDRDVRALFDEFPKSTEVLPHRCPLVLATVSCDEDDLAVGRLVSNRKHLWTRLGEGAGLKERINDGIAGDNDLRVVDAFGEKGRTIPLCRSEVPRREATNEAAGPPMSADAVSP